MQSTGLSMRILRDMAACLGSRHRTAMAKQRRTCYMIMVREMRIVDV